LGGDLLVNALAVLLILEGDLTEEGDSHGFGVWESTILNLVLLELQNVILDEHFNVI
jgi:hypothetical protein